VLGAVSTPVTVTLNEGLGGVPSETVIVVVPGVPALMLNVADGPDAEEGDMPTTPVEELVTENVPVKLVSLTPSENDLPELPNALIVCEVLGLTVSVPPTTVIAVVFDCP
jgi:hypothetical protein